MPEDSVDPIEAAIAESLAELEGDTEEAPPTEPTPEPEAEDVDAGEEVEEEPEDVEEDVDEDSEDAEEVEDESDPDEDVQPAEDSDGKIVLSEDLTVVLEDGTEVPAKEVLARQADYTRKTQELAEQRKAFEAERETQEKLIGEVEEYFNQRTADPIGWAEEIVGGADNPTAALAQVIVRLANSGQLSQEFLDTFGIKSDGVVSKTATSAAEQDRVARLEAEIEALKGQQQESLQQIEEREKQQQAVQKFNETWDKIKSEDDLEFESPEAEQKLKVDLVKFAVDQGVANVEVAWAAFARKHGLVGPKVVKKATPANDKKRKTKAVSRRSSSGGKEAPKVYDDLTDAVLASVAELEAR